MGAPSTAIERFDLSMSVGEFDERANRMGFIALKMLPVVVVAEASAQFAKLPAEAYLTPVEDTVRAPKSGYRRDDFEWETDSYNTLENGVEEVVDDQTVSRYGNIVKADRIASRRGVNRLLQALEQKAATAIENQSWAGSAAVSTPWTTKASATPVDDLDNAMDALELLLGMRPNAIQISGKALRRWGRTDQVKDEFKGMFGDDTSMGMLVNAMKQLHELEHVFVANGLKNTAGKGQSPTIGRFWDPTKALVFYHSPTGGEDLEDSMPSIGKTIMHQNEIADIPGMDDDGSGAIIVEEYREESVRGSVMRFRFNYQQKLLLANAGYQLTGVIA